MEIGTCDIREKRGKHTDMCESRSLSLDESVRLWRRFGACAMFARGLRCPLQKDYLSESVLGGPHTC